MKPLSRLSVAACTALALGSLHAQTPAGSGTSSTTNGQTGGSTSQYGSGTSQYGTGSGTGTSTGASTDTNNSMSGTSSGSSYGNSSSMQSLPTEPTAAGDSYGSSYQTRDSWLPYTTSGYIGLSIGNGTIEKKGCLAGQNCDDPDGALSVVTGGMFTPYVGMQLGYFRLGSADRNGGQVKVSGVNLSLTGVAALGTNFSLVGRLGGTYGWTDTNVGVGVPAADGKKNGFGPAYGVGLSWDFNRNWSATLDWDRHHLKYADDERRQTDVALLGLKYRF